VGTGGAGNLMRASSCNVLYTHKMPSFRQMTDARSNKIQDGGILVLAYSWVVLENDR